MTHLVGRHHLDETAQILALFNETCRIVVLDSLWIDFEEFLQLVDRDTLMTADVEDDFVLVERIVTVRGADDNQIAQTSEIRIFAQVFFEKVK